MGTVELWTDGACERNPGGLATYGFVVRGDGLRHAGKGVVGKGEGMTNNVAEWAGVEQALRWLAEHRPGGVSRVVIRTDSQLVVNQLNETWRCNRPAHARARDRCLALLTELHVWWDAEWIPRDENAEADALTVAAWVEAAGRPFPERPAWWRKKERR